MTIWKLEHEKSPQTRALLTQLDESVSKDLVRVVEQIYNSGSTAAHAYLLQKYINDVVNSRFGSDVSLEKVSNILLKIVREFISQTAPSHFPNIHITALEAMKFLGTEEDIPSIISMMKKNENRDIWEHGIEAIQNISETSDSLAGLEFMCEQLNMASKTNSPISTLLISGIGSFENEQAKEYLFNYFKNESISEINRSSALYALLDGFGEDRKILNLGTTWLLENETKKGDFPIFGLIENKCKLIQSGIF